MPCADDATGSDENWNCLDGRAELAFACSEDAIVTFSFETWESATLDGGAALATPVDHSFFVSVDDADWDVFSVPNTETWTVHPDQPRSITAGTHSLFVHSRTTGTKLRTVRINDADDQGKCGWTSYVPAALRLKDSQPASYGKIVAPMTVALRGQTDALGNSAEYVWAPDSAVERGCSIDPVASQYMPQGATCGRIEMAFVCDVSSEVRFAFEILTPSGNDDSFFVNVQDETLQPESGPPETWHAGTTGVSATQVCTNAGGLPLLGSRVSAQESSIACCASSCDRCRSGYGGVDMAIPDECNSDVILADRGSCTSNAPPCVAATPWEWRTPSVSADGATLTSDNTLPLRTYTVQAGLHYLVLHQREDGAKVRTVKFESRGSCGFAPDAQLPASIPAAFATVHPPMVSTEGSNRDGVYVWEPDTAEEGTCNPNNEDCGYVSFPFSCATDTDVGFEYEIRAPSGDDNQLGLQVQSVTHPWPDLQLTDGPVFNPPTSDPHAQCAAAGGIISGDSCCPAGCGACGGTGCGSRPGGSASCCAGAIQRAGVMCGENGALPPCVIPDPWEWRRFDGGGNGGTGLNTWPVKAGNHLLFVHSREDGVRLRAVRFGAGERGSCGFASELLLPGSQPMAFSTVTAPMERLLVPGAFEFSYNGHAIDEDFMVWTPDDGTVDFVNPRTGVDAALEDPSLAEIRQRGGAQLDFSCSAPSQIKLAFNVVAGSESTDSLFIQLDYERPMQEWNIPRTDSLPDSACTDMGGEVVAGGTVCLPAGCLPNQGSCVDRSTALLNLDELTALLAPTEGMRPDRACCIGEVKVHGNDCFSQGAPPCIIRDPFQWREHHQILSVDAGPHKLQIVTRETGLQIRDVRLDVRGTCGFAYEVGLPPTAFVTEGNLLPPMVMQGHDYVYVPNGQMNQGCDESATTQQVANDYSTTSRAMCGSIEFGLICGGADVVQFAFDVSAPNGNDDSFYIQLDDGIVDTFHIPRTGMEGGATGIGSTDDTGHACTHDNCADGAADVSCEALGGILGSAGTGADVCCPAGCGICTARQCQQASENVPPLRGGGRACCPRDLILQQQEDFSESDRCNAATGVCAGEDGVGGVISSTCGDAGVTAPCVMPDMFEWRSFMFDFDITPGVHKMTVHAREDGTMLRASGFGQQRGTCGFAADLLLPRAMDTTWGQLQPPMTIQTDDAGAAAGVWVDPGKKCCAFLFIFEWFIKLHTQTHLRLHYERTMKEESISLSRGRRKHQLRQPEHGRVPRLRLCYAALQLCRTVRNHL